MSGCVKLKQLECFLCALDGFANPKIQLEQYETPGKVAAISLFTIQNEFDALEGKMVLDAGCGTGILALGAAALEAGHVIGVEIDASALRTFGTNIQDSEMANVDALHCDFLQVDKYKWGSYFDTVIMNPPFGTKHNAGMDMKFVEMALEVSCGSVYSLHKTSTRPYIAKKVKDWEIESRVVAELEFDLPKSYKFHQQKNVFISVDLWKLTHNYTD